MAIRERLRGILDELIATGYPEQVAERIASGDLPMDTASRMQRAEAMGFDPTEVQYHGTEADITSFIPSASGKMGPGVYTTPSQSTANTFSGYPSPYAEGGNVMPLLTRGNYIDNADAFAMRPEISGKEGQRILNETLQEAGYAGRQAGGRGLLTGERVTFDPRNVRSLFAAFDPEYKGSNILGGTAAGGLGLTALMAPEEAEAKTPEFLASLPQLEPYEPGMVEGAVQNVAEFLKDIGATESDYTANQMASSLSNLADFTPVVGDAKGFAEARDAFDQGNYGEAALLGGLGLLGLIPVGGDILAGAAKGMFIGPSARNFNFEQMRRHQEMEEAGKSQREILAETGVFRGADGRVRSEISDEAAKSTPFPFGQYPTLDAAPIQTTVGGILEHPELFRNYPFLQDVKVNNMAMTDPGTMPYAGGYYDPSAGELTLNPLAASSEDATRNIMLHELQHMVQQAEGFAKGGNSESAQRIAGMINRQEFQDAFDYGLEDTAYKRTEILDELRALRPAETLYRMQNISRPKDLFNSNLYYKFSDDIRREIGPPPRRGQASLDYAQRAGKVLSRLLQTKGDDQFMYAQGQERLDEVGSDIKRLMRNAEAKLKRYDANPKNQEAISAVEERKRRNSLRLNETEQETYNRLGGEVESRNTEARQAMTMEERLATPYYLTQDIPNREQEMYRLTDRGHLITYPDRNRFDLLYPRGLLGE